MLQAEQVLHDRYQLKRRLGDNPRRQTWLAEDIGLSPPEAVVIKLLTFGGEVQWDDLKLFEREAQILKQLDHPRIPKYRDYFHIDERSLWFGLVQEYIPGVSLKEKLAQSQRFTEKQVRKIAVDVLKILEFLHQLNPPVLHRDIKPSNLIWGEDERIYLVDFGAVQDWGVKEGVTFTVVGTYGYAPMEQFGGRAVAASDLYALGATLIHLLTGTSPSDLPQENLRIRFQDRVNLNPRMRNWLKKLIEPAPEQRFKSASQALSALNSSIISSQKSSRQVSSEQLPRKSTAFINNSGQGRLFDASVPVPEEIKQWNWGAFFLPHIWSIVNQVWIGLLVFVPVIGAVMAFVLAAKGNEWAWKSRRWSSIQQFKRHQGNWIRAGLIIGVPMVWIPALLALLRFFGFWF